MGYYDEKIVLNQIFKPAILNLILLRLEVCLMGIELQYKVSQAVKIVS